MASLPDFSSIEAALTRDIPLHQLEARLRPTDGNNGWDDASRGGFLAPEESLLTVVRRDYDTLTTLGMNYVQMAKLAADGITQTRKEGMRGPIGNFIARHWRPLVRFDRKQFTAVQVGSLGRQSCPWECNRRDAFGYNPWGGSYVYVKESGKNDEILERYLEAMDGGEESFSSASARRTGIGFGGMDRAIYLSAFLVITDLTPHLIASHYFFQGEAAYRTDPRKLIEFVHSAD